MIHLSGPQETLSNQSISQPSPKLDKGKAKMREYEDQIGAESIHSLNHEFQSLDIHIDGVKEAIVSTSVELRRSTYEKNLVSHYGYDDYVVVKIFGNGVKTPPKENKVVLQIT